MAPFHRGPAGGTGVSRVTNKKGCTQAAPAKDKKAMARKRDGFVPLGDVAGGVELPGGRALTPAVPQALHHFTRLDQIDQLIEASEADADLGFMARLLALCSLPRTNPGDRKEYVRRNGPYALVMSRAHSTSCPTATSPVCC